MLSVSPGMKRYFPLADSRKKGKVMPPSNESAGDGHDIQDVLPATSESMPGEIIHLSNRDLFERIARLSDQELEERIAILRAACGADVASLLPDKGSNSKISLFMHQHEKDRRLLAAMLSEKDFKIEDPNMKTAASADVLDMAGRATGSDYIQPISHLNTPKGTQEQYTSPNTIRSSHMGKAPMANHGVKMIRRNTKLTKKYMVRKKVFTEFDVDFDSICEAYPKVRPLIDFQEWEDVFTAGSYTFNSEYLFDFYHTMTLEDAEEVRFRSIVGGYSFHISPHIISEFMHIPNEGKFFDLDNHKIDSFYNYVSRESVHDILIYPDEVFTPPLRAIQLLDIPFVLWKIICHLLIPQNGHWTDVNYTCLVLIYCIVVKIKVNLPWFMLHHMWRSRNQKRCCLPYPRIISLFFEIRQIPKQPYILIAENYNELNDASFVNKYRLLEEQDKSLTRLSRVEQLKKIRKEKGVSTPQSRKSKACSSMTLQDNVDITGASSSHNDPFDVRRQNLEVNYATMQDNYTKMEDNYTKMEDNYAGMRTDINDIQLSISSLIAQQSKFLAELAKKYPPPEYIYF